MAVKKRQNRQQRSLFKALIKKLSPSLQKGFLDAIREVQGEINWIKLINAIKDGDIDSAISAIGIESAVFDAYRLAKQGAFSAAGILAASTVNLPSKGSVTIRFDMSDPTAEAWITQNAGTKITKDLAEEQIQNIRAAILRGYASGEHPNTIAVRLIGSKTPSGYRGGLIGLSSPQEEYVRSMRARLESGTPGELKRVLGMSRRNRNFDGAINRAISGEEKLSGEMIDRMVNAYSDRLLKLRAETIARTETGTAVMDARSIQFTQAVNRLWLPDEAIIKTWRHGGGVKDPRLWHKDANGMQVRGINTPFVLSNGSRMRWALDREGGAKECINCTCDTSFRIDHSYGLE